MSSHKIPAVTVRYGSVLDLMFDDGEYRITVTEWRGWHMLVGREAMDAAPGRARIYLVRGRLAKKKALKGDEHDRAQEQYERWHQRDAQWLGELDKLPSAISCKQGRVLRIGYKSDKWSKRSTTHDYDHDFTEGGHRAPLLYTDKRAIESSRAAVIVGGDMAITEGGID